VFSSTILLLIIGVLSSFGQDSRVAKLVLLGGFAVAFYTDFSRRIPRTQPLKDKSHLLVLLIFQLVQSLCWVIIFIYEPAGFYVPRLLLVVIAGFPWLILWLLITTESRNVKLYGLPSSGIGAILWAVTSVCLSKLGVSADNSLITYGGDIQGSIFGNIRLMLPGFPGVVSGGVFCGLALASCLAAIISVDRNSHRITYGFLSLIMAFGIYITDVRSAVGVVLLLSIYGVYPLIQNGVYFLIQKRRIKDFKNKNMSRLSWLLLASVALPFIAPLLIPKIDDMSESIQGLAAMLIPSRNSESPLSLGGRTSIWRLVLDIAANKGLILFAFNVVGENGAGISEILFDSNPMPGTSESAHSHNAVLNYYFSFGIIGLTLLSLLLFFGYKKVRQHSISIAGAVYVFPFVAFMIFMSLESLLSVAYIYFSVYFTLFNCDLLET
jgi:O-antigen ligase